jgi:molybdopterin-guanine dinucleotide biosynthesis protein
MPVMVVGGQARNVGKTSLIASLLRRFAHLNWTAVKVTSHHHEPKDCVQIAGGRGWTAWKQLPSSQPSDTVRYLEAGATTALLLQADDIALPDAASFLRSEFMNDYLVIESTRIAEYFQPECFVMILAGTSADVKHFDPERLSRVDAFVTSTPQQQAPSTAEHLKKPLFVSSEPESVSEEFWNFISEKLRAGS